MRIRALCAALLLVVAGLLVAGCGSGGASGENTASVIPASAFVYFEADIDPEGGQEQAMRTILERIPGEGAPEDRLGKLLEKAGDEKTDESWEDVKKWLGGKVAVFATGPKGAASSSFGGALVFATKDSDAAEKSLKEDSKDDKKKSYKDHDYYLDKDGTASGLVDGFGVVGSESGFKAAVDASKEGSLEKSDRFKKAEDAADDERVGFAYIDLNSLLDAAAKQPGAEQLAGFLPTLRRAFGGEPATAILRAETRALVVESRTKPAGGLGITGATGSTPLLGELPSGTWAAVGAPQIGKTLGGLIDLLGGALGGRSVLAAQLKAQTGLDLDQDLLGWMGDLALFVRGTDMESLGGGAVIETTDPRASALALAKLRAVVTKGGGTTKAEDPGIDGVDAGFKISDPELPQPIYVVQAGKRVVIAYGEPAAAGAIGGDTQLKGDAAFKAAGDGLGSGFEPSLFVSVPQILDLAKALGASGKDYDEALPYLKVFDSIAAGSRPDGDRTLSKFRISVR